MATGHKAVQALCFFPTALLYGPEAAIPSPLSWLGAAKFARLSSICLNSVRSIQRLASSSVALICNLVVSEINDLFKISLIYAE